MTIELTVKRNEAISLILLCTDNFYSEEQNLKVVVGRINTTSTSAGKVVFKTPNLELSSTIAKPKGANIDWYQADTLQGLVQIQTGVALFLPLPTRLLDDGTITTSEIISAFVNNRLSYNLDKDNEFISSLRKITDIPEMTKDSFHESRLTICDDYTKALLQ